MTDAPQTPPAARTLFDMAESAHKISSELLFARNLLSNAHAGIGGQRTFVRRNALKLLHAAHASLAELLADIEAL